MKKINRPTIILVMITILAALLRFYKLTEVPISLFGDEIDVGYQAYSILKTGKDYMGQSWPISFHSLADWRTPLFLYGTVPFIWLFGLSELGVRFQPALFGLLTVPVFFLLVDKLFDNKKVALLSCLFLAISPWHLQYSRAAFEVSQMVFLLVAGFYLYLKGLEKWSYLVPAAILLALAPYSYNTAKFYLPIFVIILVFSFWEKLKKISKKRLLLVGAIFLLVSLPMATDIVFGKAGDRFSILSIFTDPTVSPQIGFDRQVDMSAGEGEPVLGQAPSFASRAFHNKYLVWGQTLLGNYFKVFSTEFLFLSGDINLRHSIQGGFGELYWFDIIFLLLGFFSLVFLAKDRKVRNLVLAWFFTAPISSILTRDGGNHATRLILLLPPLLMILGLGANYLLEKIQKRRIFSLALWLIVLVQTTLYLHRYYIHYPLSSEEWWHYGFKQQLSYLAKHQGEYDYVIISDRGEPPLIFSLFWLKIDPILFQQNKLEWTQLSDAVWASRLPGTNYYFGHVSEERIKANGFVGTLKPEMLYMVPEGEIGKDFRREPVPPSISLLETTLYPDGRIAGYLLTGK